MRTRPAVLVGAVLLSATVYALLLWAATTYDASVDRVRPLYEDRAALAEALHDDAEATGRPVEPLVIGSGEQVVLAGESFRLTGDAAAHVVRWEGAWCVVVGGGGLSTGWRCWDDGEDPGKSPGRVPEAEPPTQFLELDTNR